MENMELIRIDVKHGSACYPKLKDFIKHYLENHEATEQEIEQVYNHILMEILK